MDGGAFARPSATPGAAGHRRRAIAGLVAGAAAVFGRGLQASAGKRCRFRPRRACRSRKTAPGPTTCAPIAAASRADAPNACPGCCGADDLNALNFAIPKFANSCGADFRCNVKECPIRV